MPIGGRHSMSIIMGHLTLPRSDSVPSSQCFPFNPVLFIPVLSVCPSALCAHPFAHDTSLLLSIPTCCPSSVLSAQRLASMSTVDTQSSAPSWCCPITSIVCIRPGALHPFFVLRSFFAKHTSQLLSITAHGAFSMLSIHLDPTLCPHPHLSLDHHAGYPLPRYLSALISDVHPFPRCLSHVQEFHHCPRHVVSRWHLSLVTLGAEDNPSSPSSHCASVPVNCIYSTLCVQWDTSRLFYHSASVLVLCTNHITSYVPMLHIDPQHITLSSNVSVMSILSLCLRYSSRTQTLHSHSHPHCKSHPSIGTEGIAQRVIYMHRLHSLLHPHQSRYVILINVPILARS
jgi:hypothetical protein